MEPHSPTVFTFAAYVYDAENRRLTRNRVPIRINKQMLDLLDLLVRNGGRLVTRDQIQSALWPDQFLDNREKQITNAVSRLRYILGDSSSRPRYIESVPRTGYRLIAKIEVVESDPPEKVFVPTAVQEQSPPPEKGPAEPILEARVPSYPSITTASAPVVPDPPAPNFAGSLHSFRRRVMVFTAAAVVVGLMIAWRLSAHRLVPPPGEVSLGIAPLQASGPGAADLAESFRLDLTDTLAQLPRVNVRASHSLDLVNLDQTTFRDQAMRLGLDVLILGSFTVDQNNNCHVTLELVRGKNLSHLASFDRTVSRFELASLRTTVQNEVYESLKLATAGSRPAAPVDGTSDPRAYDAYLRAGYHYSLSSKDSLPLAVSEYNEAIAADPQFVNAYAGLGRTYIYLVQNELIGEKEGYRLASEAARHALLLDPHSAEAHAALGFVDFLYDWNLTAGEDEFRKAISVNPNDPSFHQGLALIFCDQGRFREAEAEIERAHIVDPFWVSAYITDAHISSIAGDRPRAQAVIRKIMELAPDSAHARDSIGNAQWNLGLYAEAIATWREMAVIEKDSSRVAMEDRGLAQYRSGGVPAYARVRIDAIRNGMKTTPHTNDFYVAEWYAQSNERDRALKAIRAGIARHEGSVPGIVVLPAYISLHADPGFQSVVTSLGLRMPPRDGG